jgi:hypothetical protein
MIGTPGIDVIRALIENFFYAHNPAARRDYFTPDIKRHGGSVGDYEGVENYAKALAGFFKGLPDVHAVEQDALERRGTRLATH